MINKWTKPNGVTLIALVITIIVLLILAGVAISMLSGENGILRKAADAKTKTEEGQRQEETTLTDMEIETHFITNNSKYKCRYGCITGIEIEDLGKEWKVKDKVKDLKKELPEGYNIIGDGITDETDLRTGMEIQKDGRSVARTIVYGDVYPDGKITQEDQFYIMNILSNSDYKKEILSAYDIDGDNEITQLDYEILFNILGRNYQNIDYIAIRNKNEYASNLVIFTDSQLKEKYIQILKNSVERLGYSTERKKAFLLLKGIQPETEVGLFLNLFSDLNLNIKNSSDEKCEASDKIENGYKIYYTYRDGREIYLGKFSM